MTEQEVKALLIDAFIAGEALGQENAKMIYTTTYPVEKAEEAAPKYAEEVLLNNQKKTETEQMMAYATRVAKDGLTICPESFERYMGYRDSLTADEAAGMELYLARFRAMFAN